MTCANKYTDTWDRKLEVQYDDKHEGERLCVCTYWPQCHALSIKTSQPMALHKSFYRFIDPWNTLDEAPVHFCGRLDCAVSHFLWPAGMGKEGLMASVLPPHAHQWDTCWDQNPVKPVYISPNNSCSPTGPYWSLFDRLDQLVWMVASHWTRVWCQLLHIQLAWQTVPR